MSKNVSRLNFRRVDIQVFILTACVVVVSCFFTYLFAYKLAYNDTLKSLTDRVYSIHNYLETELDKSVFTDINSKEDMSKPAYIEMKELFTLIKETTGVQYLYTAKRNDQGEFIYVIDGLPDSAPDFRYPGDLIEVEIIDELDLALSGQPVLPDDIVRTSWGDIFIVYLPIHGDEGSVVGTIGIEFEANHQYNTYRLIRIITPIIIFIACSLAALFSVYYFRRISNPHFQDFANTDYLTGLKNRNAYELDTNNMCVMDRANGTGIVIADLNGLKRVNDNMGHNMGDMYIKSFANALKNASRGSEVLYRMGGDEFAVVVQNSNTNELMEFIGRANKIFMDNIIDTIPDASASFGVAICDGKSCKELETAYRSADSDMYDSKNRFYEDYRQKISPKI